MEDLIIYLQRVGPDLIEGMITSLKLTLVALSLGVLAGLPAALARVYGGTWVRRLAIAYIEIFRGTPLLVQLFIVYYGLPDLGITLRASPRLSSHWD